MATVGEGEEEAPRAPGDQVESDAISQDQRVVFMKPKYTESTECPAGGLRGGQAGSLLMEADWGIREGDRDMAMQGGQPGRWSRWRGWHSAEWRAGSHPLARPTELPADGRGVLKLGRLSPGREPGGSQSWDQSLWPLACGPHGIPVAPFYRRAH